MRIAVGLERQRSESWCGQGRVDGLGEVAEEEGSFGGAEEGSNVPGGGRSGVEVAVRG